MVSIKCCHASPRKWPLFRDRSESVRPQLPVNLQHRKGREVVNGLGFVYFFCSFGTQDAGVKFVVNDGNALSSL